MRTLVFLTKAYPFDHGEEFIENEMNALAASFDRIVLIATSTSPNPVMTRAVPENVEVHHIAAKTVNRRLAGHALRYFLSRRFGGYLDQREAEMIHRSGRRRAVLSYFLSKAEYLYRYIETLLAKYGFGADDTITFYSYWFHDTALAAVLLRNACAAGHKLAVSRAHRYDVYAERNTLCYLPARGWLLAQIDAVYACSDNGRTYLAERYPAFSDKLHTAYLGTNDHGLSPIPADDLQQIHLVSCSYVSPVKRVMLLAQSLQCLADSGLRLKWTHLGGGDGLDEIRQYAKDQLDFMECHFPGSVKNEELMAFYQQTPVDLFINVSASEGLPVTIMEAASFGIPILATDVGGTSEIVRNDVNGHLLAADFEPHELADWIRQYAALSQTERIRLRENARAIWQADFHAADNYVRFAEILHSNT